MDHKLLLSILMILYALRKDLLVQFLFNIAT